MLLAIDIGNTHVVMGVYNGDKLIAKWRLQSDLDRTVDEYAIDFLALLKSGDFQVDSLDKAIICCVVPQLQRVFAKLTQKYLSLEPTVVDHQTNTSLNIDVEKPSEVGSDRIVNAVAAKELVGFPAIVVDFGTATTFDVLGEEGEYQGGVISPGLLLSANALFERGAQLTSIELRAPEQLIGKTTEDCMRSGIVYGYAGLVDGILQRLLDRYDKKVPVIATGGLASMMSEQSKLIDRVIPDLTLEGLKLISNLNLNESH